MPFPSPPWQMRAQAWMSVFVIRGGHAGRPAGVYGAAFVEYQEGSPLTYHELLVARLIRDGRSPRVRITDIWVDSPASRTGGRALWAIPKEIADLPLRSQSTGLVTRTAFSGVAEGRQLASATFSSMPTTAAPRLPFTSTTSQEREDGSVVVTAMAGSAKVLACRGSWTFDADGPLEFLAGHRPLLSLRLRDVRLRFG